uniref:T-cell receptor alpha/delta variable 25.0.4 n=1 Tax=Sinocyclocheilus anshuiensis TaxID=1608454 RepID=A0A671Q1W7_9TELE
MGVQVLGEVLSADILCYTVRVCVSFGNVITPVQPEVFGTEGDNITLSCNYSSAVSLQWYRQYPNSAPEFLLIILQGTGKVSQKSKIVEQDPRFSGKSSTELTINSLTLTDSALYYCALRRLYKNSHEINGLKSI